MSARESDGSFLEKTLREAIADRLPGSTGRELRLNLPRWGSGLGGVDVSWSPDHLPSDRLPVLIETKIDDVDDGIFDVLKLASALSDQRYAAAFVVVAARIKTWRSAGPLQVLADHEPGRVVEIWDTATYLKQWATQRGKVISKATQKPHALPARFGTVGCEPVALEAAPGYEIRIIEIARVTRDTIAVDRTTGAPGDALVEDLPLAELGTPDEVEQLLGEDLESHRARQLGDSARPGTSDPQPDDGPSGDAPV